MYLASIYLAKYIVKNNMFDSILFFRYIIEAMAKVPITIMGYRCERCGYEWIPRDTENEPRVCSRCKSPYWNRPRKASMMDYEDFRDKVKQALKKAKRPLTWTEVRTAAELPQAFPNNKWVHQLEKDIGLKREKDKSGVIHWQLS
jgi:predicted Zn-ribbon and HTH transcriptional regulator